MRISEEVRIFWRQLTGWQQGKLAAAGVILLVLMFSGWLDACRTNREVKRLESEAGRAKAEAAERLRRADRLAAEAALAATEVRRLEERHEQILKTLEAASRDSDIARREWERIRREPRTDAPDADTLCRELAELGYPCG